MQHVFLVQMSIVQYHLIVLMQVPTGQRNCGEIDACFGKNAFACKLFQIIFKWLAPIDLIDRIKSPPSY
jgi:hypothetical protein